MSHIHAQSVARQSPYPQPSPAFAQDGPGPEQPSTTPITQAPRAGVQGAVQHLRDGSVTRGRPLGASGHGNGVPSAASVAQRAASAQRAVDPSHAKSVGQLDTAGLQRRASNSYGHHRQASYIHGLHHSRNPSFNSPTVSSPLSPESLHNAQLRNAANMRRAQGSIHDTSSIFPSPLTPDSGHSQTQSIDSALAFDPSSQDGMSFTRRRAGTSRGGRGHNYGSSGSSSKPELRTPGEFALHHLFHAFVVRADAKINQCVTNMETSPTPVESACGKGADAGFDQLISALGHIVRQEPKPLVDSLMLWRKAKGDIASTYKKQLYQHKLQASGSSMPSLPRRHTEPVQDPTSPQAFPGSTSTSSDEISSDEYLFADQRATISVYILCRVLIEIFEQSNIGAITLELTMKLEEIVFTQLKDVEPAQITTSSLRLANWRIYGELLGQMSRIDFVHIATRFLGQLGSWQQEIAKSSDTVRARDLESRVEMLLHSMRNLHLSVGPTTLYSTCDFLTSLATLFADSHGPTIKQAYCHTFEKLLLQTADEPENVQNVIRFKEFGEAINQRLFQMMSKVRHWSSALPVSILLLCLSPIDTFVAQWFGNLTALSQKLKDKSTRTPALRAICQLLWTYLHRVTESSIVKLRKTEEVIRLVIPPGKKLNVSTEASVAEAMVYFIRIVGFYFPDTCFRHVINPLINFDLVNTSKDLRIEQMEPEKMVIGIRSFLTIITDLEQGKAGRPRFPMFTSVAPAFDGAPMSPNPSKAPLPAEIVAAPAVRRSEAMSFTPVNTANLDDQTKEHYLRFCEILGKITILCDHTFGSSATLNEKFAMSPNAFTPKTPLVDAFTMMKREDVSTSDHRQSYYDLLHVAIQALPRCLSEHIPLNALISLLCTGSAHVQGQIASSATQSLKAIARQGHAQAVATAFPRFIFLYDSQYSTMSDEGRLGPAHIETTLTLYLDLLHIWTEQLKQKAKTALLESTDKSVATTTRAMHLEITNTISLVDEMEAYGLFFLCSQSRRVRAFAIRVLRLVIQFDDILGKDEPSRVIRVLENKAVEILDLDSNSLSVAERSRLQKDKRGGSQNTLIEICSSEVNYDSTLWFKGFPNLIRHVFEMCPNAVALSRVVVCDRLALMQPDVEKLASGHSTAHEFRLLGRSAATPIDVLFDQWKLYLVMACVTMSSPGGQSQSQLANATHIRKTSRNVGNMQEKLSSARALFSAVIPMLAANQDAIRNAVVIALGSINRKLYRTLLESLQYAVISCNDDAKARITSHQRTPSSPQRSQVTERMRAEVTHIYKLTSTFLRHDDVLEDEWVVNNLVNYTRDLRLFLSDADIQNDYRFVKIRYHYCGLIEELYTNVNRCPVPSRWLPFESRKSAFALMEEWCGFAPEHGLTHKRDDGVLDQNMSGDRTNANANVEKDKSNLRLAALSAMAGLCAGPVSISTDSGTILQFNLPRMLAWIDAIFAMNNERMHTIGQTALRLLLLHNADLPQIIEHAIKQCYNAKSPRALESYFSVVTDVLIEQPSYPVALTRILVAVIFTLGNETREIRMRSAKLLRILDDRQQKSSKLEEFDISITDKTKAVYKLAQFMYSKRLAKAHPELGFAMFSEFCLHFRRVSTDHQRNMVAAILPWLQMLELQVDPMTGGPTAVSYMLLSNMLEITIRFSSILYNEVQALWQALATGPHAGNVQLVLDFIISLSLDRREQNFVDHAKQIVVYLSATPAGSKVLEFLLIQLVPKNMINEKKMADFGVPEVAGMSYIADLTTVLPMGHKQAGLSLGQVSLIFLVDLMVPPVTLSKADAIKLVHAVTILWDHYTAAVQEQAREMLVHLIHELVTTKVDPVAYQTKKQEVEEVIEAVRGNEINITWTYEDHTGKDEAAGTTSNRVPIAMTSLTARILDIFGLAYDDFSDLWAKEALHWASICPVRHLACRSFQVFRCISVTLDSRMLADMLARLSNTIADEQTDYQTFSLEILTTLKVIIGALETRNLLKYPQLFWTTCACLTTIHEREFFESLGMLEKLLSRIDLRDPQVVDIMLKGKPEKWEGGFEGLQKLVYKGLRSADCLDRTLNVLHDFAGLPDNDLVGKKERLLFNILANLPTFLHGIENIANSAKLASRGKRLADFAQKSGYISLSLCLNRLAVGHYISTERFLHEIITAIKAYFLPEHDAECLIFIMGLLTNQVAWFRVKVIDVLFQLIQVVDMKHESITCHGPDLISPLLRLLQTEHCQQALHVLDHIIEVPCAPMDRAHLRMSMASGTARAIRKEYEKTQSLFGIPMASGWSIPMPAIQSNFTRNNVHAVFYTCGDIETTEETTSKTPDVEFQPDEGYTESYFPGQSRDDTMRTIETATDTNMGDIVSTLDSLDDFFDDPDSATTPTVIDPSRMANFYAAPRPEHDNNLYEEHTAPILSRSLARTSSSLSFQNGFESRPSTGHQHRTQSSFGTGGFSAQTSFSSIDELSGPGPSMTDSRKAPPVVVPIVAPQIRPGLHARSITTPANQFAASHPTSAGFVPSLPTVSSLHSDGSYFTDESFSDSENAPFPALTTTISNPQKYSSSQGQQITPTSAGEGGAGFSFRRGMRRLTGGKSESTKERERARLRAISSKQDQVPIPGASPKVPRVPLEYLNGSAIIHTPTTPDLSRGPQI